MIYKSSKSKKVIKKINWLLRSVNLSLELLKDTKWKKVYALLKKSYKYLDIKLDNKKELKIIARAIASGNISKQNYSLIVKSWFNIKKEEHHVNLWTINYKKIPFTGTFFDQKQIFLC